MLSLLSCLSGGVGFIYTIITFLIYCTYTLPIPECNNFFFLVVLGWGVSSSRLMSDFHSAIRLQQLTQRNGTAAQCDIFPEGFHHPPPGSIRGLVTIEDRPVEDLEARLMCSISDVPYQKLFMVLIFFCVSPLTTKIISATFDGVSAIIYKNIPMHYDSKD